MKKFFLQLALFAVSLAIVSSAGAQPRANTDYARNQAVARRASNERAPSSSTSFLNQRLPASITLPGADLLPISGMLHQQQSDGRALHNVQVDPDHPKNMHVVIMQQSNSDPKDTNFSGRRLFYSFSSDGGKTWKSPVMIGNTRTGFPCMILYKRNGVYIPIIAAHRYLLSTGTGDVESAIWVEQGNPGDGNFTMVETNRIGAKGSIEDILWPYIAASPDGSKLYIVGSVNPAPGAADDYLQFGSFSISGTTFTWNGWTQADQAKGFPIGALGNDVSAGLVEQGDYVMRVSPKGKIGLLWRNTDVVIPEANLYFIESTDGGASWPTNFDPIVPISGPSGTTNDIYDGAWTGMDFYYDGESPKVLWSEILEQFKQGGTGVQSLYYPSVIGLHFMSDVANLVDNKITNTFAADSTESWSLYHSLVPYPIGSLIKESDVWLAYPTLAKGTDPNVLQVFYQTFPAADSVQFNDTTMHLYGSIYTQKSNDGGLTWTDPEPYRGNSQGSAKFDFRYPQVSYFNPNVSGAMAPQVMYSADTAAGEPPRNGAPDWDLVQYFHQGLYYNAVHGTEPITMSLMQNYPNPVRGETNIGFTLESTSNVVLTVSDVLGRPVATLASGKYAAGDHTVNFQAKGLPDGIYRYTLQADGQSVSKCMSLIR